jgi:hypothetical protein
VLYPTALIDRNVGLLRRNLRRLHLSYRRNHVNALMCLSDGEGLIRGAYGRMQADVKVFILKRGLAYSGDQSELEEGLSDSLGRWRRVVHDFSTGSSGASLAVDVGACSCSEHRVFSAAQDALYWLTYAGIIRRIDGLSQDFMFRTVNGAMKMVAVSNGVQWMHWVTAGDDRVCPICLAHAAGGNNGYYKTSWFMPVMPSHNGDRCLWELILLAPLDYLPND